MILGERGRYEALWDLHRCGWGLVVELDACALGADPDSGFRMRSADFALDLSTLLHAVPRPNRQDCEAVLAQVDSLVSGIDRLPERLSTAGRWLKAVVRLRSQLSRPSDST